MDTCSGCRNWITCKVTRYQDGSEIEQHRSPDGKGQCAVLGIETGAVFGCMAFEAGLMHIEVTEKTGAPWQHFVMIPCPDCGGKGDGGRGHRCAGTGLVRLYDDGYIGDEQTRMHPNEKVLAAPPSCQTCKKNVSDDWQVCPFCGGRLRPMAEIEVIKDALFS